ncbi:sec-independent protein translocase TatA/E [Nocardioides sp. CF8]|jgi:sec-independent protein translocase protein TatA|uniref:twin-arginine translocase TatA/TatE family subunit n=1 Tax=Nocardioides sp. CF8 TaxID=110319 RepID=UPI00033013CC|nr:twin-arginine translocase TatA/TatE family subunit [Nocardioides sp. CF8]EON24059.1 sec-independent protein translocase TatA/E [Nocardioides sp. CF8]
MINPLIGMPQGAEWLVILAIVVLVFGAAKLPELARGTGQALRIFKTETKGLRDDDDKPATPAAPSELPPTSTTQAEPTMQSEVEPEIRSDKHTG